MVNVCECMLFPSFYFHPLCVTGPFYKYYKTGYFLKTWCLCLLMGEFKLFIFIVTNLSELNFSFYFACSIIMVCLFFFLHFLSFTALFQLSTLSLFLFIFPSGLGVTYSISLLFMVWIVSKADWKTLRGS